MDTDKNSKNILRTWKEISSYLDCDVRTCRRWEKNLSLPVHRIDDSTKSRVFAYESELENWLQNRINNSNARQNILKRSLQFRQPLWILAAIFLVVSLFIAAVLIRNRSPRNPANFRIDDSHLVVLNDENEELWRYDTGIPNLNTDEEYRKRFQYPRRINGQDYLPHLIIQDIDQDGRSEVVLSIQTQDEYGEGVLLCFDHTGRIRWNCTTGRELKFGNTIYSSDYRISGFFVHDFDSNGRSEIIIVSAHRHFYPTQLSIVGADGELIGEYWNSGRISDVEITDLNGDGKEEVVVSGCNNEYGKACLIVFDSDQVKGCSPQHPDYRCSELEDGMEKYYILFPRTEIDILESPVESIRTLEKLRNNRLSLRTTHSQIIYELDQNLILMDIRFSHAFEMKHKEALLEGRIRRTLDNEHRRLCEEGILYFNGKEWVPEPTMTNYWKN